MESSVAPIQKCPFCGADWGYYTKEQARGTIRYCYEFDGSEADNSQMYDGLTYTGGEYAYCQNCDKRLFKMSEIEVSR